MKKIALAAAMILAAALSVSCNKGQYVEDIASSDWLWVSAGHTPGAENQTMMLAECSKNNAPLQTLNLGKDYSSFSEGKEYSASVTYKTPWDFENQESAWWLVNGDTRYTYAQIYRFCMTEDEAKAVAGYYKGSPYTNMVDVLTKDALCTLPFSESEMAGKKIMMQLQTDGSDPHQKDSNYYINARRAMEASKDFNIGKKTIGIAWLERHGFLWMEQWCKQWDTYYNDQLWFRTEITGRY